MRIENYHFYHVVYALEAILMKNLEDSTIEEFLKNLKNIKLSQT
jgi:hypothetical protein